MGMNIFSPQLENPIRDITTKLPQDKYSVAKPQMIDLIFF
jgi:hypothetical protein